MDNGIKIGRLRHFVQIRKAGSQKGGLGQSSGAPETVAECWASVRPIGGDEKVASGAEVGISTHDVLMRYMPGIKSSMQIKWGDRVFEISAPPKNIKEESRFLLCSCKELL